MLRLLETDDEISEAQHTLRSTIQSTWKTAVEVPSIGYPAGNIAKPTVNTNGENWYWFGVRNGAKQPGYLNWFGSYTPEKSLSIDLEVNSPVSGFGQSLAGYFAEDLATGQIYLMHSGRIAGGKPGVGKIPFLNWALPLLHEVRSTNRKVRRGIIVMPTKGKHATNSALHYISQVREFKAMVRQGEDTPNSVKAVPTGYSSFYSEPWGKRSAKLSSNIDYLSRHGEVVDYLKTLREAKGLRDDEECVKNTFIDVGVLRNRELVELYEVKTSVTRQDMYCAIGQLLVHSRSKTSKKYLVIPDEPKLPDDIHQTLVKLKISIVRYSLGRKIIMRDAI